MVMKIDKPSILNSLNKSTIIAVSGVGDEQSLFWRCNFRLAILSFCLPIVGYSSKRFVYRTVVFRWFYNDRDPHR